MRRREIEGGIRFITFSCEERLPLLSNPRIADVFVGVLDDVRAELPFMLYAWVLMPEHVHLLVRPPRGLKMSPVLKLIKQRVANQVLWHWKQLDAPILKKIVLPNGRYKFWLAGGGFDRNVRDVTEFSKEIRYTHRNPVERGLVAKPEDWKWSSVRWWMGQRDGELRCDEPPGGGWDRWKGFM